MPQFHWNIRKCVAGWPGPTIQQLENFSFHVKTSGQVSRPAEVPEANQVDESEWDTNALQATRETGIAKRLLGKLTIYIFYHDHF